MDLDPKYNGMHYPITKTPNGVWLVIGVVAQPDHVIDLIEECGRLHSYEIHFDGDDPNFEFLTTADLAGMTVDFIKAFIAASKSTIAFKGPRAVVDAYNAPFRRSNRLRLRRATEYRSIALLMDPHYIAKELISAWKENSYQYD